MVEDVRNTLAEPVPLHLRNSPTKLMKDLGYGKGYQYAHDSEDALTSMTCLPGALADRIYFQPSNQGVEKSIQERLRVWREKIKSKSKG